MSLQELLSADRLREMAGTRSYKLGEDYHAKQAVKLLACTQQQATATVHGTSTYHVELRAAAKGALRFHCDCPFARDTGAFCKHAVAVALAVVADDSAAAGPDLSDLARRLRRLDAATLAELLLEAAQADQALHDKLSARLAPPPASEAKLRKLVDKATDVRDYTDWDEAARLLGAMVGMVDKLTEALTPATAPWLVGLLEHAIVRLDSVLEFFDDSDGQFADCIEQLGELHLAACRLARPDPVQLGERLFHLRIQSQFNVWDFDHELYGEVLGDAGRQRHAAVAEAAWEAAQVPGSHYHEWRQAIEDVMLRLARDDIDRQVALLQLDLEHGYRYRQIVSMLVEAGRQAEALDWAKRGIAAFPEEHDAALTDIVVAAHVAAGEFEPAIDLRWQDFLRHAGIENYRVLEELGKAAGQWPALRERALALVDERSKPAGRQGERDTSTRVAIALWEHNPDEALEHAENGRCAPILLDALAQALEAARPDDAFALYRRLVQATMESTSSSRAYPQAFELVQRIGTLLGQDDAGWNTYLVYLRTTYSRKRTFIKLLDGLG